MSSESQASRLPDDPDVISPPLHRRGRALVAVFTGGLAGAGVRYWIEHIWVRSQTGWPAATFTINLVGAFVLGVLLEALARGGPDVGRRQRLRLLVGTGFCGALTTYSTMVVEAVELVREGVSTTAVLYLVASVSMGVLAAWSGIILGARFGRVSA